MCTTPVRALRIKPFDKHYAQASEDFGRRVQQRRKSGIVSPRPKIWPPQTRIRSARFQCPRCSRHETDHSAIDEAIPSTMVCLCQHGNEGSVLDVLDALWRQTIMQHSHSSLPMTTLMEFVQDWETKGSHGVREYLQYAAGNREGKSYW